MRIKYVVYISPLEHDVRLRFQALAAVAWLGFQALAAAADTLLAASDDAHLACTVVAALPVCVAISWSRNVVDRMSCCSLLLKANGMATAMLRLVALDAAVVPPSHLCECIPASGVAQPAEQDALPKSAGVGDRDAIVWCCKFVRFHKLLCLVPERA